MRPALPSSPQISWCAQFVCARGGAGTPWWGPRNEFTCPSCPQHAHARTTRRDPRKSRGGSPPTLPFPPRLYPCDALTLPPTPSPPSHTHTPTVHSGPLHSTPLLSTPLRSTPLHSTPVAPAPTPAQLPHHL
ncbi:hypothetical protein M758_10G129800 [Ceratodon purpureus]|nr:hypothetical protein M758_10G129800 [Ceratodon purpureus]